MMAAQKHFWITLLTLSSAVAQDGVRPATVQKVTTSRQGPDLRIEITISAPVKPSVETAVNPNRLLLDFPNTLCSSASRSIHANGVRQVRTAQHSTTPYVTRVVLDLDEVRPYVVTAEGNSIILTVAGEDKHVARGAPVAATSGGLLGGVFRRHRDGKAPVLIGNSDDSAPPLPPPPAVAGPAFEPPKGSSQLPPPPPAIPATANSSAPSSDQSQIAVSDSSRATSYSAATSAQATSPEPVDKPIEVAAAPMAVATPDSSPSSAPATAPAAAATTSTTAKTDDDATEASSPTATTPSEAASASTLIARTDDPSLRTVFRVKYVAEGVVYLEGGRAQGLAEGMKLLVEDANHPAKQGDSVNSADPRVVAVLEVSGVADTSSVTDIHDPKRPVKVGDLAYLSSGDAEALVQQRTLSATRQYPAVISFTEGDTLDEEARQEVPRPPLPSVNRARGRFGFDSFATIGHGTNSVNSTNLGVVFRGDITRIGGTYWNLSGYWRGRLTKQSTLDQKTLQETLNRTYHLNMTYDNPNSSLVAGFGRLYLPWAPSLDTIDGGYFGTRLSKGKVLGIFAGSTPDPSSWDYSPDRVIGGAFINFEGGEFDGFHYSSTSGAGVSMVRWAIDRPFVFFEDSISYKRTFGIYESAQLDSPKGNSVTPSPGPGLGRNFFTFRVNPHQRVELDANYNYFRDIPTFDPTLVGTSLLDKYLFQGFSAGGRVEVCHQIWVNATLGRSSGSGDSKSSLNQMYGLTFGRLPLIKWRADVHYSRFNSSFGDGHYESFSLSRQVSDRLRLEVLVGQQNFVSSLTTNNRSRFLTGTIETTLSLHYYLQSNFTTNRGDLSYDQVMFSFGYRFDNKRKHE